MRAESGGGGGGRGGEDEENPRTKVFVLSRVKPRLSITINPMIFKDLRAMDAHTEDRRSNSPETAT